MFPVKQLFHGLYLERLKFERIFGVLFFAASSCEKILPAVGPVRAWGTVSNLEFELRQNLREFQIRPVMLRITFTAGKTFSQLPARVPLIGSNISILVFRYLGLFVIDYFFI